ncbi:MAG: cytochrome c [Candidatus Rokubacteria bacterium]|nr:cytochrome c [Candidatus Rokubacteria bacterium]
MGALWRSLTVAVATAALLAGTGAAVVLAQGEWAAPADAKAAKNPVKGIGGGKKSVETNCASCHGSSGKGDGPAASALPTKPADWTSAKVQAQTDGELFWKIANGRGAMPPWKHLPDKERWEIVNYIRTLKK